MTSNHAHQSNAGRRAFLADTGMGFTGLALGGMLFKDGVARAQNSGPGWRAPDGSHHAEPKAKSVIWIFLIGGASHLESFDVKPALNRHAGKTIDAAGYASLLNPDLVNRNLGAVQSQKRGIYKSIFPLSTGYKTYGQSGLVVSDWFPHLGRCADDLAVVRSMWTQDNNHGAQLTFHTGRNSREGAFPTVGSWVSYGLGTANENLPQFVVLGEPSADCCGAAWTHGSSYLGPQHSGVKLKVDPKNPLPFMRPADPTMSLEEQARNFGLLGQLNRLAGVEYPDDQDLQARIKSYELAFQMQTAVPDVVKFDKESKAVVESYGINEKETKAFGQKCLTARRLVERGVRFIQLFHGHTGSAGAWDSHTNIKVNHTRLCKQIDKPIAGLIADLKQRGLLDETLVLWGTEFGRTPGADLLGRKVGTGRDHHPHGFSVFLAGGGTKPGIVHGATDEIGFHAIEDRHYVTDIHATVLHQMGLDSRKLEVPGRKRLEIDHGEPIHGILA
jgi:hypothetical protein